MYIKIHGPSPLDPSPHTYIYIYIYTHTMNYRAWKVDVAEMIVTYPFLSIQGCKERILLFDWISFFSFGQDIILLGKVILLQRSNEVSFRTSCFTLHKQWSFPLKISSVNVTKSAVSCGFGLIYWRKLHFLCSVIY